MLCWDHEVRQLLSFSNDTNMISDVFEQVHSTIVTSTLKLDQLCEAQNEWH